MTLALGYGSILNHHESANVKAVNFSKFPPGNEFQFEVSMGFVCGNRNVLKMQYACMQACTHKMHGHINIFKVTKDIPAGQEILVRYGGAHWFESKNIPYSDADYASTMWRPDLEPLPCRENINLTTGADGRPIFSVPTMLPSGIVMDVSLCVKVSLIVVDQFHLWDFVLIDPTAQTVCAREDAEVCW